MLFGDINAPVSETGRIILTPPGWAYLKIAEGCDNRCSYCIIPTLRGGFRSRPMENILEEAEELAENGVKEIIVIAQDITRYGEDLYGKRMLPELLEKLCEIDGIVWVRLHYLYPDEIDDALIDVVAENDKLLNYLDIPIQHINDKILSKMNRRGDGAYIRALFKKLRERIPGLVLRTSLITGLPGEGEAEFSELCEFLREAKIERAGVFPYSPEEQTPAYEMPRPDRETAVRRSELISELQSSIMDEYNESRVGTVEKVLCEGWDGEYHFGRSFAESPEIDGYILFEGENIKTGEFYDIDITNVVNGEPAGKIIVED
jgi:ribosomal protein S12 methylthiotransferase